MLQRWLMGTSLYQTVLKLVDDSLTLDGKVFHCLTTLFMKKHKICLISYGKLYLRFLISRVILCPPHQRKLYDLIISRFFFDFTK